MRRVLVKALLTGLFSMLASLALSFIFVPMMGGKVAGAGLVMTILCPLVISIPASALHFWQSERVRQAEAATADALEKLAFAYEQLRQQSRRDGLTGALNRNAFLEELDAFSRKGMTGALIFFDLDHFKSINDLHGHATGDDVLRRVGHILATYRGQFDITGRLGGEEFALFQGGATSRDMLKRCEEMRERIERLDIHSTSGTAVAVSASIGAFYCERGFDSQACLKAADINLYQAKARGRNQVVSSA